MNIQYRIIHYILPYISTFTNIYNLIIYNMNYYYNTVNKAISSDYLYFFENNPSAYLSSYIEPNNNDSGTLVWKYNRYTNTFGHYNCNIKDTKHFPVLSASLTCDNKKYILDDFLNNLKVEKTCLEFPTLQNVIEVWSYNTGIVLDRKKSWKFNYLDTNINEFTLNVFKESWNFVEKE